MKVLIVNFEYPPLGGGGGVATKQFAKELAKRHDVHVLTTAVGHIAEKDIDEGVTVHRVRVFGRRRREAASLISMLTFVPMALIRGFSLCREFSFDVLNAQFVLPSGIPGVLLAKLFNIPFVLSFIGGDVYDPTKGISPHRHWIFRVIIRVISRGADACTAISEDTKRRAQELHGVNKPITVTHLGIAPSQIMQRPTRDMFDLPFRAPIGISVGRLIPRKGYEVLIRAWKHIEGAHLIILGDGPLRDHLQHLIHTLGLADRVFLYGFVSEIKKQQLLRVADVYVSAAEHEGFGLVFLEAMDAGLPIVAANDGGQRDFLIDGRNALLIPPRNQEQLRSATVRLLENASLREQMQAYNLEDVTQYYLSNVTRVFEDVLEGAQRS